MCECWVEVTTDGRFAVTVTGSGCDHTETVLHWNAAQELFIRERAALLEQGWAPVVIW